MTEVVVGFIELRFQNRVFLLHRDTIGKIKTLDAMIMDCQKNVKIFDSDPDEFQEVVDYVVKLIKPKMTPHLHTLLDYWDVDHELPLPLDNRHTPIITLQCSMRNSKTVLTFQQHEETFIMRFLDGDLEIPFDTWNQIIKTIKNRGVFVEVDGTSGCIAQQFLQDFRNPVILIINLRIRDKIARWLHHNKLTGDIFLTIIREN